MKSGKSEIAKNQEITNLNLQLAIEINKASLLDKKVKFLQRFGKRKKKEMHKLVKQSNGIREEARETYEAIHTLKRDLEKSLEIQSEDNKREGTKE